MFLRARLLEESLVHAASEIKIILTLAVTLTTVPITWMRPASESLLISNPLQKSGELLLFVR